MSRSCQRFFSTAMASPILCGPRLAALTLCLSLGSCDPFTASTLPPGVVIDDDAPPVASTPLSAPLQPAAGKITGVVAEAQDAGGVRVTWSETFSNETGFVVQRYTSSTDWVDYARLDPDTTAYVDPQTEAGVSYCYRILVVLPGGQTIPSSMRCVAASAPPAVEGVTPDGGGPPDGKVTAISAQPLSATEIEISWSETCTNEDGFTIQRYVSGSGWEDRGGVGPDETRYVDAGLDSNRTYCYRVIPFNAAGTGSATRMTCARTSEDVSLPPADTGDVSSGTPGAPLPDGEPTAVVVTATSGGLAISWTDGCSNEEGFRIRRYASGESWADLVEVPANQSHYLDSSVVAGKQYCYRVAAFTSGGTSAYTSAKCAMASGGGESATVRITGRVALAGGGLAGVTLATNPPADSVTTDANGYYALTVPKGWSGTVTPSGAGYTFEPSARGYGSLLLDLADENYAALAADPAGGEVYYVSPTGSDSASADGSASRPFRSAAYALSRVGGGRTIILMPGDYTSIRIDRQYAGTASSPTRIRAAEKWKARILPAATTYEDSWRNIGVWCQEETHYVVIEGLQIANMPGRGIDIRGHGCVIRDCWIHHCGVGDADGNGGGHGIACFGLRPNDPFNNEPVRELLVERSLIEYCGHGGGTHPMHGVYAGGIGFVFRNNVVRYNADCGLMLGFESFDSPDQQPLMIDGCLGFRLEQNLCYGNANAGIVLTYPQRTLGNELPNVVAHNTAFGNTYGLVARGGASTRPNPVFNNVFVGNGTVSDGRWWSLPLLVAAWQHSGVQAPYLQLGGNVFDAAPVFRVGHWTDAGANRFDAAAGETISGLGYLLPGSAARARGDVSYRPSLDFWGRPRIDSPADSGAFAYDAGLTQRSQEEADVWAWPP